MPSSKKDTGADSKEVRATSENGTKLLKIIAVFFSPLVVAALIVVAFRTNSWTAKAAGLATAAEVDSLHTEITQTLDTVSGRQDIILRMQFYSMLQECTLSSADKETLRRRIECHVITLDSAAIYLMTR